MTTRPYTILSNLTLISIIAAAGMSLWAAVSLYLTYANGYVSPGFQWMFDGYLEIRRLLTNDVLLFMDQAALLSLAQTTLVVLVMFNSYILAENAIAIRKIRNLLAQKGKISQLLVVALTLAGAAAAGWVYFKLMGWCYSPGKLMAAIQVITGATDRQPIFWTLSSGILTIMITVAAQFGSLILGIILQETGLLHKKYATALGFGLFGVVWLTYMFRLHEVESLLSGYVLTMTIPYALMPFLLILCLLAFLPIMVNAAFCGAIKILQKEGPLISLSLADLREWFRKRA